MNLPLMMMDKGEDGKVAVVSVAVLDTVVVQNDDDGGDDDDNDGDSADDY